MRVRNKKGIMMKIIYKQNTKEKQRKGKMWLALLGVGQAGKVVGQEFLRTHGLKSLSRACMPNKPYSIPTFIQSSLIVPD
jgi:hypothetical protein